MGLVSLVSTSLIAYGLGARGAATLPIAVLVGFFPIAMVVSSIGRRVLPPTLIISGD
jgi:hypothetical protein